MGAACCRCWLHVIIGQLGKLQGVAVAVAAAAEYMLQQLPLLSGIVGLLQRVVGALMEDCCCSYRSTCLSIGHW
jgi:hypothetical protein